MAENLSSKLYEDTILNGRFTNSEVVRDLSGRTNQYGENRQIEAMLKGEAAASIIRFCRGDQEVARGIAIGLELSKPNFEKVGRDFLETKISDYKRSKLGVALTKVMLNGLSGPRIDSIIKGVEDVLDKNPELSEEAKAAIFATEIRDNASKFKNPEESRKAYIAALYFAYKGTEQKGMVCSSKPEMIKELRDKKPEKDIIQRNPNRSKELEQAYNYYIKHFDEVSEKYKVGLEGEKQEDIVAYYVVSMKENKLHELYVSNQN